MHPNELSNLKAVLSSVLDRLGRHRSVYERNETAVREQIILPVLRGLGWDTENPDEVHPEDKTASGSSDYTLKVGDRRVVTIEVKNLGVDVASPGALEQAHRYASSEGIELCIATNGAVWVLARSFEPGRDLRGRIIWQVLLSEGNVDEVAQKLVSIAKGNISDFESFIELQDSLNEKWEELLSEPTELVESIVTLLRASLSISPDKLPYPDFINDYVDQRVREILAADAQIPVRDQPETPTLESDVISSIRRGSAAEILVEAAERAIREGRLTSDSQIDSGHARFLVSKVPIHKNNRHFFNPRQLSNGLYIETHCAIAIARKYAQMLDDYRPSSKYLGT